MIFPWVTKNQGEKLLNSANTNWRRTWNRAGSLTIAYGNQAVVPYNRRVQCVAPGGDAKTARIAAVIFRIRQLWKDGCFDVMLVDEVGRPGLARDAITGYSNIALVALPRISGSVTVCCVNECVLCSGEKSVGVLVQWGEEW